MRDAREMNRGATEVKMKEDWKGIEERGRKGIGEKKEGDVREKGREGMREAREVNQGVAKVKVKEEGWKGIGEKGRKGIGERG